MDAGVFGYADDLLLLCPSRSGLQNMLDIAEEYAKDHKISFSTDVNPSKSKTKGIIFSSKQEVNDPEPLILNGTPCHGSPQENIWATNCAISKMDTNRMSKRKEHAILNVIVN